MTLEKLAEELHMNLEQVLDRMVHKPELLIRLLRAFLASEDMELAQSAWEKRDYKVLEERIHSMKGAAVSLGLPDMSESLNELLTAVRRERYEDVPQLFGRMEQAYNEVERVVSQLE